MPVCHQNYGNTLRKLYMATFKGTHTYLAEILRILLPVNIKILFIYHHNHENTIEPPQSLN